MDGNFFNMKKSFLCFLFQDLIAVLIKIIKKSGRFVFIAPYLMYFTLEVVGTFPRISWLTWYIFFRLFRCRQTTAEALLPFLETFQAQL